MEYPAGYKIKFVDPVEDKTIENERSIIWYGPRNFGAGEPSVILEKRTLSLIDILLGSTTNIVTLTVTITSSLTILTFWIITQKAKLKIRKKTSPIHVQTPIKELKDDRRKIIKMLRTTGTLYQSTIAKQCGFSKSKTSQLLAEMEKKGLVTRKKRGREKLVTLIRKVEDEGERREEDE